MKYFVLLLLFFPSVVTAQRKDAISTKGMQDGMDNEWKNPTPNSTVFTRSL